MNSSKRFTAIMMIAMFVTILVGLVYFQYEINNLNNPNSSTDEQNARAQNTTQVNIDVKITDFHLTGYNNPVGVVWNSAFVLKYLNNGKTDVSNVTITFDINSTYNMDREIEVFNSTHPHYYIASFAMGESYPLGIIKAGEAKEFYGDICNNLDDSAKIRGFTFMVILKSNDTILDQATVNIP